MALSGWEGFVLDHEKLWTGLNAAMMGRPPVHTHHHRVAPHQVSGISCSRTGLLQGIFWVLHLSNCSFFAFLLDGWLSMRLSIILMGFHVITGHGLYHDIHFMGWSPHQSVAPGRGRRRWEQQWQQWQLGPRSSLRWTGRQAHFG